MDGLILIKKPPLVTSHDVVAQLRAIFVFKKIGHFGTLDPLATGLLLVAVGKGTRFFPFFSKLDKVYQGRIRLGIATDTYDSAGVPMGEECRQFPDIEDVRRTMHAFQGVIRQIPPPFSAKKFQGRPLYSLARKNFRPELPASQRIVHFFNLKSYAPPDLDFEVKCSSGTYVRALAHDLGLRLGCGAHLAELIRTEIGDYRLADALCLEEIRIFFDKGQLESFLHPLETFLPSLPKIVLAESGRFLVQSGRPVSSENLAQPPPAAAGDTVFRLFSLDGRLIAMAKRGSSPSSFAPILVLS